MATEQLKYDFTLNLERAERNIDRFVTSIETRFDRVSSRMERAFEKISRGAGGGGRSGGGAGSSIERQADRAVRRQASAQREADKQQRLRERELAADKAKHQREEDKRIRDRDRRRKQQAKDIERDENAKQRIVEQYEQKRRTRHESLENISSRAELRSRGKFDRIDWEAEDEQALAKALKARHRFAAEVARITKESSWKSTATIGREVAEQEAIYKGSLDRITTQHRAKQQDGTGGARMGKFSSGAFQVQQMIEDGSYAGWRGISNNLAFLGASIGGSGGLAIVAAVAAKGLYDLAAAMLGTGDQADKLSARVSNATSNLDSLIETRRRLADEAADFTIPGSDQELARRQAELGRRREKITNTPDVDLANSELSKLKELERIYTTLRRGGNFLDPLGTGSGIGEWTQYLTTGPTSPGGIGLSMFGERLDMTTTKQLRQQFKDIQSSLSDPNLAADPGKLSGLIETRERELAVRLRGLRADEQSADAEDQRLVTAKQVFEQKKQASLLEDEVTDKLKEQQRAEERLADTARDRAKAVRDAIVSASDAFESKMLDARADQIDQQFSKRVDRMVDIDARRQRNAFNRMFPQANDRQKENFETWLAGRGDSVRQRGEQELFNRQFRIAQERAKALKARADQEASAAREAGRRGDMDGMNAGYEKAVKSLEQIQELNWQMQARGENPARSANWLKEIEKFQGEIAGLQNEQAKANDNLANSHQAVTQELDAAEARLKQITTQIDQMNASDEKAAEPWKKVNQELDGTLKRLQQLKAMKDGKAGPVAAPDPAGPASAVVGQITLTNRRKQEAIDYSKRKPRHIDTFGRGMTGTMESKALGYLPMVRQSLRQKENEFLAHKDNALDRKRFQGMWNEYGEISRKLESGSPVNEEEARQAADQLQLLLSRIKALDAIQPVKVFVDVIERHHSQLGPKGTMKGISNGIPGMPSNFRGGPKFRATGGPVSRNAPYIVGEKGHELFIPSTGGYVVNATDTRRMLSGGHQPTSNIASTTSNTFTNNYGGVTINTASVNLSDIQRQTDWREKAKKSRMGT